jgi:hypothetical protein
MIHEPEERRKPMTSLVQDAEKYGGQYVTTRDFLSREVVTHDRSAVTAYEEAKKQGVTDPVLIYVPEPGQVSIY